MQRRIFWFALIAALLAPGIAAADRDTRFDVGLGIAVGGFGIGGEVAREVRAEGGPELRVPLHVRVFHWEGEVGPMFRSGAADGMFDSYGASGLTFRLKRFVSLGYAESRRGDTWLHFEGYARVGADRVELDRLMTEPALGLAYGAGLQVRLMGGSRRSRVGVSYAAFVDVGRAHLDTNGAEAGGGVVIQSITFGLTLLGMGG